MSTVEQNKKTVLRFYEHALVTGDASAIPECFSPEFLDHDPPRPGFPQGQDNPRAILAFLGGAFSERRVVVHDLVGEGDKVVLRFTIHAMNTGPFMGRS